MKDREEMLRRLQALGFDTAQCADMPDERLAGWIDECEMIAYRVRHGHLPPDESETDAASFDPERMAQAYETARSLTAEHGARACGVVMDEIIVLASRGDRDGLRRCGAVLQALRDLDVAKAPRH